MKIGLLPLTVTVIALGTTACSELQPEVSTESQAGSDSSGTTGGPTTGVDPDTTTGVDPDTTGEQTSSVDTTTQGSATDTTTTEGETESETDETTTGGTACVQLTVEEALSMGSGPNFWETANVSPNLGDPDPDLFRIEFHPPHDTGTYDLGAAPEDNYMTCEKCLRVFQDSGGASPTQYFQESGTLDIEPASMPSGGPIIASTTDVVLVEVTVDEMTLESTPVEDGACIELVDYSTAPNNTCAGMCGMAGPVPGSFPECGCDATCFDSGTCCEDICDAGICDAEMFCMAQTHVETAGPGLANAIVDNAYDGTLGSMSCETLMVAADGIDTIADVSVEIGMVHTWVGDLVIKVVPPSGGNPITVLSRPGRNEPADDGSGGMGDSSNLIATDPIIFYDGAATDAEDMGDTIGDGSAVCAVDGFCDFDPNPGAAIPGNFATLVGQSSVGAWEVCVGDGGGGDIGLVDFIELTIDQVP